MHVLDRDDTIPTLFGAIAFAAGVPTHVPPECVREVERAGAVAIPDESGTAEQLEQPAEEPFLDL